MLLYVIDVSVLDHLYISNYVDGTDLDMILENGDRLFESLNLYIFLGVDNLPRTVNVYCYSLDMFLLDSKTGEIKLNAYVVSLKYIIKSCL